MATRPRAARASAGSVQLLVPACGQGFNCCHVCSLAPQVFWGEEAAGPRELQALVHRASWGCASLGQRPAPQLCSALSPLHSRPHNAPQPGPQPSDTAGGSPAASGGGREESQQAALKAEVQIQGAEEGQCPSGTLQGPWLRCSALGWSSPRPEVHT